MIKHICGFGLGERLTCLVLISGDLSSGVTKPEMYTITNGCLHKTLSNVQDTQLLFLVVCESLRVLRTWWLWYDFYVSVQNFIHSVLIKII